MKDSECEPVSVSRRIAAPAGVIFKLLKDPVKHPQFDGSGMLRSSASTALVSNVGEVFSMKMHNAEFGDYVMDNHVVEYELNQRIGWAPTRARGHPEGESELPIGTPPEITWTFELAADGPDATVVTENYDCSHAPADLRKAIRDGKRWVESMTKTLERLDELCADSTS